MRPVMIVVFLLAGCSSHEERMQRQAERDHAACVKGGYVAGTEAFDTCRLRLRDKEEQRRADRVNAIRGLEQMRSNRLRSFNP